MRISDWSSDVCSSDLMAVWAVQNAPRMNIDPERVAIGGDSAGGNLAAVVCQLLRDRGGPTPAHQLLVYPVTDAACDTMSRTEERRVGNGGVSTCRSRWSPDHYKKNYLNEQTSQ